MYGTPEERAGISEWVQVEREEVGGESIKQSSKAPSWEQFLKMKAVKRLLSLLRSKGMCSLSDIKRGMRSFLSSRVDLECAELGIVKPNGLLVGEMYELAMCESGRESLPEGDSILCPKAMTRLHCSSCEIC